MMCACFLNFLEPPSSDPLEDFSVTFPSILQGGGINVRDGDVTIQNTNIYSNTASYVSARLLNLPGTFLQGPPGRPFCDMSCYAFLFTFTGSGKRLHLEFSWNLPPVTPWKNIL